MREEQRETKLLLWRREDEKNPYYDAVAVKILDDRLYS
jgi:hypothetical protein